MRAPASRPVPLTRRLLLAHVVRTLASVGAVGTALTLMLLLTGLWAGVRAQTTAYEDHLGAQLVVVAPGTETLFAEPSRLPATTTAQVASIPGVTWAAPARAGFAITALHGHRVAIALVGFQPGAPGGPWSVTAGRAPRSSGEISVDRLLAQRHGLRLGGVMPVMGSMLRIVGLTSDTAMFMTPLVFVTERQSAALMRSPKTTGIVLVGTEQPGQVAARLRLAGFSARTPRQLHDAALGLSTRIFGTPLRLMVGVSFVAGTLIVALVLHMLMVEQRRQLGVLKALGASGRRLAELAVTETFALAACGFVVGAGFFLTGRALIAAWRPQFPVLLTPGSVTRVAIATVAMAALAAVLPARRVARLDAASAFRSAS